VFNPCDVSRGPSHLAMSRFPCLHMSLRSSPLTNMYNLSSPLCQTGWSFVFVDQNNGLISSGIAHPASFLRPTVFVYQNVGQETAEDLTLKPVVMLHLPINCMQRIRYGLSSCKAFTCTCAFQLPVPHLCSQCTPKTPFPSNPPK
jgi:hypothetical protein